MNSENTVIMQDARIEELQKRVNELVTENAELKKTIKDAIDSAHHWGHDYVLTGYDAMLKILEKVLSNTTG